MEPRSIPGSPMYMLERSDVGLVQLDRELPVARTSVPRLLERPGIAETTADR